MTRGPRARAAAVAAGPAGLGLTLRRLLILVGTVVSHGLFPGGGYMPWAPHGGFAVRFRKFLERLGLTYLKLGQFLAMRFDVLPPEVARELQNLWESVNPMPLGTARGLVEAELGRTLEEAYSEFDPEPVAAASVAQVHRARTHGGERVAVKVQRAGLGPILEADIRILGALASFADRVGAFGKLSARGMLEEFAQWTRRELDFTSEARTADRLRSVSERTVLIPRVFWPLTTPRVLTMEFMEGVSASHLAALVGEGGHEKVQETIPGFDVELSLRRMTDALLRQLFLYGFFHGDPHPGNILFSGDNRVGFLDFGIFGSLNAREREILAGQIENLAIGDIERSFRFYAEQLTPTADTDWEKVHAEATEVLQRWYDTTQDPGSRVEDRHLAKYTAEMIEVSRRNHLRYGLNYLLFWRTLNSLNATIWMLDREFDLMGELRTFFRGIRPGLPARLTGLVEDERLRLQAARTALAIPRAVSGSLEALSGRGFRVRARVSHSDTAHRAEVRRGWEAGGALLLIPPLVLMGGGQPVAGVALLGVWVLAVAGARRRRAVRR